MLTNKHTKLSITARVLVISVLILGVLPVVAKAQQVLVWDQGSWDNTVWASAAVDDPDGDGVLDVNDSFPLDAAASVDTDGDGAPDDWNANATQGQIDASSLILDDDDDDDGILDVNDAYPLVPITGYTDTDGDGAPDVCDADCQALGMSEDVDDDNDGTVDYRDAFPLDPTEISDIDGDNIGDNADNDDDNDGTPDIDDVFPGVDYQGQLTTADLTEVAMPTGLVTYLDSAVEDPAVRLGQAYPSWYLRADGTYVSTGYPRHEGTWVQVDDGYVLTQDDNGIVEYPQFDDSFDNVNRALAQQDPAGQIAVRGRNITRIAVRAGMQGSELWQLSIQTRYEQFAVDSSLALDPSKPVRVLSSDLTPISDVIIIAPTASTVPFTAAELLGSWTLEDLNLDAVESTSHCTVGTQCSDIILFNANGTAITELSGRSATWLINGAGGLELTFVDTGAQMFIDRLVQGPDTSTVRVVFDTPDRFEAAVQPMIKRSAPAPTDVSAFYGAMLSNGFTVTDTTNDGYYTKSPIDGGFIGNFGFVLNADGSGSRVNVSSQTTVIDGVTVDQGFVQVRDITWTQTDSQITSEYCFFEQDFGAGPVCLYLQTRTWDLIAVTAERLYVHEGLMLEYDSDNDGVLDALSYKLSRPNFYELTSYYDLNDVDRDGYANDVDAFPTDPAEWEDLNGNGIGDNTDQGVRDSDGDGVVDANDAFPDDPAASVDTDADGAPDDWNANATQEQIDASSLILDDDDDDDGILDINDVYPLVPVTGYADTDGDGAPDACDADCQALGMMADPCPNAPLVEVCPAVVVSSADVTGTTGSTVYFDLVLDDAVDSLEGLSFKLDFDDTVLGLGSRVLVDLNGTGTLISGIDSNGLLSVTYGSSELGGVNLSAGAVLARINFTVLESGTEALTSALTFLNVTLNDVPVAISAQPNFNYEPQVRVNGELVSASTGDVLAIDFIAGSDVDLLEGVAFNLTYEQADLEFLDAMPVDPLVGQIIENTQTPGVLGVTLAAAQAIPRTAGSRLVRIQFRVIEAGAVEFDSELTLSNVTINDASVVVTQNPVFRFVPSYTVLGQVSMWSGAANAGSGVVADIGWKSLDGTDVRQVATSSNGGSYSGSVPPRAGYLSAQPTGTPGLAISPLDAVYVLRVVADLEVWRNDFQRQLADINGDGLVGTVDASRILQASVGNITPPFTVAQNALRDTQLWLVDAVGASSSTYDLADPLLNLQELNFEVGLIGDVTGNWVETAVNARMSARESLPGAAVSMTTTSADEVTGSYEVSVGIDTGAAGIYSVRLGLVGTDVSIEAITPADGWSITLPTQADPYYSLIRTDLGQPYSGSQTLLSISLIRSADAGSLTMTYAEFGDEDYVDHAITPLPDALLFESSVDSDGDGLTDSEENALGTDPVTADTDNDGLSDGDEVNVYDTNPLLKDSDGDGFSDSEELSEGTDPLSEDDMPIMGGLSPALIKAAIDAANAQSPL